MTRFLASKKSAYSAKRIKCSTADALYMSKEARDSKGRSVVTAVREDNGSDKRKGVRGKLEGLMKELWHFCDSHTPCNGHLISDQKTPESCKITQQYVSHSWQLWVGKSQSSKAAFIVLNSAVRTVIVDKQTGASESFHLNGMNVTLKNLVRRLHLTEYKL